MSSAACLQPVERTEEVHDARAVYRLDPRIDARWPSFLESHPRASVFHSPEWLEALFRTYQYESFVLTTTPAGEALRNGVVFCVVNSWLTGRRLVSLPFSDHCEPLLDGPEDLSAIAGAMEREVQREHWRYIEIRPLSSFNIVTDLDHKTVTYGFHQLDLEPELGDLYRKFHKDSIQRKIRRAEREGLRYVEGRTSSLLDTFYRLFKMTRGRHRVPPQPRRWFKNLMDCFGDALKIRVAYKVDEAVSAMITLRHKDTLIYKYGGSDSRFCRFGGVHLLYWQSIQEAKREGLRYFDLGRTDAGQDGLVTFKNRWGATFSTLTYSRYATSDNSTHVFDLPGKRWKSRVAKRLLGQLHPRVLSLIGSVLYKHVG